MRRGLMAVALLTGLCGFADRASAQVIYYSTPYYYNSPFNPLVRTYSTPVMYSTYTSPIIIPTRFVTPPFGTVGYDYPPVAAAAATTATTPSGTSTTATSQVRPAGYVQPYPAFRQVGYSTYTTAALPVGGAYYSGDAYNAPSSYAYTPYAYAPYADFAPVMNYGSFASPYFQTQFGQGYGGWGMGRGWGGWGRGWGWGW
jgi:hypothetical protein